MFLISFLPLSGMEKEKDSETRNGGEKNNKGILPIFVCDGLIINVCYFRYFQVVCWLRSFIYLLNCVANSLTEHTVQLKVTLCKELT